MTNYTKAFSIFSLILTKLPAWRFVAVLITIIICVALLAQPDLLVARAK